MADKKQLEILKSGVEAWNKWRKKNPHERADLSRANLDAALLRSAGGVKFVDADFRNAPLSGAKLVKATLRGADLRNADLRGADLRGAKLRNANLRNANLRSANLSGAKIGHTAIESIDLSTTRGLSEVKHWASSGISSSTFEATAAGLAEDASRHGEVEAFYRGAGVEEHLIEYFRSRIGSPIEFYSAFISYSHSDKPFARRLYADLQAAGIRCWLDEKEVRGGDLILDVVNQAIRRHDKLILCCSLASLTSSWVEDEVAAAIERERKYDERILIPLDLDGFLLDGYKGRFGPRIRERYAIPFGGWKKDADLYDQSLEAVKDALRPRDTGEGEGN